MQTVIYADVLFLINFIIDGLCLSVSALVLSKSLNIWRLLASCVLGGLYAIASLYILSNVFTAALHLIAAFLICLIAFKWQGLAKMCFCTLCFVLVNALLGGVLYAVYGMFSDYAVYNGVFYADISAGALLAGASVAIAFIAFCLIKGKTRAMAKYADLRFCFRDKEFLVHCLCDSGNLLVCPYTALPVAIISNRVAAKIFTDTELNALEISPVLHDVRPLPASGIGGNVLLPSFIPTKAEIKEFGKPKYRETGICVAIKLTESDFGGSDGILPTAVL